MSNTVHIRILDKEYQVNCPPEEQDSLQQSARILDQRMRDIRKSGNVIGLERIAVMAALNLTYDLLRAEARATATDSAQKDLQRLDHKLQQALRELESGLPEHA